MSSSEVPRDARGMGRLVVEAPLGVEISVSDGSFMRVAQGASPLDLTLPEGVYTVRWSAGARNRQEVVRLRSIEMPLRLRYGELSAANRAPLVGAVADGREARQFTGFADFIASVSRSVTGTELLLFVRATDSRTRGDVAKSLKLTTADGRSSSGTRTSALRAYRKYDVDDGWSALQFRVNPGTYLLRYESVDRATVEQSIRVLPYRRTLGFLEYGCAARPERDHEKTHFRSRRGIVPGASTFISCSSDASFGSVEETFRLAEILLYKLSSRAGALDETLLTELRGSDVDPFLRLYASAVLLTRPEAAATESAEAADEYEEPLGVPKGNLENAVSLLNPNQIPWDGLDPWPDLQCAWWRLLHLDRQYEWIAPSLLGRLSAPPMLESAWRWASSWSIEHPAVTISDAPSLVAAAGVDIRSTPWLAWRAASLRSQQVPARDAVARLQENTESLVTNLQFLVESGKAAVSATPTHKNRPLSKVNFAQLSAPTRRLARAMMKVGNAARWSKAEPILLARLAASMGAPASTLAPRIEEALIEIRDATERAMQASKDIFSLDPLKGQFGGSAERDRRRLSLDKIAPANHPEFLALTLTVSSMEPNRPLTGSVEFHLHPTFNPPTETVRVIDGRATLVCYAMGGFTLGAETSDGIRLELDLALDERLPVWFRER